MYKLTIYAEDKPGVIARIANLLRKRNINIEVFHADTRNMVTKMRGITAPIIVVEAKFESEHQEYTVVKQLERLINVLKIESEKLDTAFQTQSSNLKTQNHNLKLQTIKDAKEI